MIIPLLIVAGVVLLAMSGFIWFWWAKHRRPRGQQQVNQLTGALRSKEAQSEILIQSITDGIIAVDTGCAINIVNTAASNMTEWLADEAVNLDARAVLRLNTDEQTPVAISDEDHPFTKVLATRERISQTSQLMTRKGRAVFISLVVSPVIIPKNNELIGAIAVFRDVSREKDEEKRRADFISTASHEMRTPVAAIEGYLALALNDKVSSVDAKGREFLEKAHTSTQHLGQLFQDLLTSAKAEDGRLTSHPVVTDMGAFLEQLAEDLRFSAQKKGLEMEYIINSHPAGGDGNIIDASDTGGSSMKAVAPIYYAHIDPDRFREVITNLSDNAVKYTERGKLSLAITGNQEVVQVRLADTGPGIPAEDLPHLFQKFYRVDNSATRSIGGTGLGLFICRKIVELYGGTIWAESTLGKGSTFYINLPRLSAGRAAQMQLSEKTTISV